MTDSSSVNLPFIPANRRRSFFWQFTLATALSWIAGGLLASWLRIVILAGIPRNSILSEFIYGAILGTILGLTQWWVLRRYRLDRLWIFNTGAGFVISAVISQAWRPWIGGLLATIAYIWLGMAQWLVLRKRVDRSWRWLIVPPIAMLVANLFRLIVFFIVLSSNLALPPWSWVGIEILAGLMIGVIFAGCFLMLHRRGGYFSLPTEAGYRLIKDREQIRKLKESLYEQIDRAWQTETTTHQSLVYGVAVATEGTIIQYQPINAVAGEHQEQTPLAQLVSQHPTADLEVAWFEVCFLPTGRLEVQEWESEI